MITNDGPPENLALNSLPMPQNRTWQVGHVLLFTFYCYKGNCSYLCSSLPVYELNCLKMIQEQARILTVVKIGKVSTQLKCPRILVYFLYNMKTPERWRALPRRPHCQYFCPIDRLTQIFHTLQKLIMTDRHVHYTPLCDVHTMTSQCDVTWRYDVTSQAWHPMSWQ